MHKLYKETSEEIEQSNVNYKLRADIRKKFKTFNIDDYVMIQIRLKQFPLELLKSCIPVVLDLSRSCIN